MNTLKNISVLLIIYLSQICCKNSEQKNDYLISFMDTINNGYGYKNIHGDTIIKQGKYQYVFTDTFRTFAIVIEPKNKMIAIDRNEKQLYEVFKFDNGPDFPSENLFRIIINGKIGFADAYTGVVIIQPQFECAEPFIDGIAKVSLSCFKIADGDHQKWDSNSWFNIDRNGKKQ